MDDIDLIKQKIDITDLISGYIEIKRAGRNFKAVCPFHNEKSPSFVISPERQIWHCFGCGKGGDIFTFVEEYERADFSEALKLLSEKAGVKLTRNVFKSKIEEKKSLIYDINHLSSQFYNYLLTQHKSGKDAYFYVTEKRGLTDAIINTYSLGFAPKQGSALTDYLINKKGYKKEDLLEAGVATLRGGRVYDFFQNRLIFPIQDARGNILAFSGRLLDEHPQAGGPKYINTKETPVYVKGDTVFGLFQAKESIKKEGKVILMEGEFDVITAFKEGITNAVAVKGTALTENQIRLLKRFAQKIVFCFDTDPAGTEAQRRSITLITKEDITSSVVVPPDGKDPDEALRENPSLFKKALNNEKNIYDFIIESSIQNENPATVEGKKHIISRTLSYISEIENEIVKEHYLKKLAALLDSTYESVLKEAEKLKRPEVKIDKPINLGSKTRAELIEDHLLTLVLQSPNVKESVVTVTSILGPVKLSSSRKQTLLDVLKKFFTINEELSVPEISKQLDEKGLREFDMYFLNPLPQALGDEAIMSEIEKTAKSVKNMIIKDQLKYLSDKMRLLEQKGEEEELQKLRVEFNQLASSFK